MESVYIWYLTDNNEGRNVVNGIKDIGLDVKLLSVKDLQKKNIIVKKEYNLSKINTRRKDIELEKILKSKKVK